MSLPLALLVFACGEGSGSRQSGPPPVSVEVVTLEWQRVTDWIELPGQLESEASVVVKPEISGVIAAIDFVEGEPVRKGEVLVTLRDEEQVAALHEAEAKATLAADVYQRTKKLAKQNVSAATELDRARSEYEVTKAAVEVTRVMLDRTRVRAPFDGVAGARLVEPGERVDEEIGLVQIDAIDRLQLVFAVTEVFVSVAEVGLPVSITVAPIPDKSFQGEVFFVAPALDPRNRQLLLKAWIPNHERLLKPGLFAKLRVQTAERDDALVAPESAIVYDNQGSFVWRVSEDGLAERVAVELGTRRKGTVEIQAGLQRGDRVVSAGTHKVESGSKLRFDPSAGGEQSASSDPT